MVVVTGAGYAIAGADTVVTSMGSLLPEDELYPVFEDALRSRGMDLLRLARLAHELDLTCIREKSTELAKDRMSVTDEEWGKAFWELLKEAIDRLKPLGPLPKPYTPEWHPHIILYREYVIDTPNKRIARDLGLSLREVLRRRRIGIRRIVRQFMQWG